MKENTTLVSVISVQCLFLVRILLQYTPPAALSHVGVACPALTYLKPPQSGSLLLYHLYTSPRYYHMKRISLTQCVLLLKLLFLKHCVLKCFNSDITSTWQWLVPSSDWWVSGCGTVSVPVSQHSIRWMHPIVWAPSPPGRPLAGSRSFACRQTRAIKLPLNSDNTTWPNRSLKTEQLHSRHEVKSKWHIWIVAV